ncbi:hypothetical protein SBA4_1470005 [Candidatus Sulfopaludibacter sp. SbA4]|nr:hypothetical protein SBA4_1470005 [Candidatus Sulfopaludibacter sp. SbA4]
MVLLGVVLAGLVVVCYQLMVQHGRMVLRIEALEKSHYNSNAGMTAPEGHPLWRFSTGNQWEADNVWGSIFMQDEYGIRNQHFEPEDIVVDVGAHIGTFSYLCYIRGSRSVYSYEASARNFEFLQRNLGGLPGIRLFHKAVWRSDGEGGGELLVSGPDGQNTGAVSALAAGRLVHFSNQSVSEAGPGSSVPAVALDEILADFPRVKLLKLDCEGSEFPILLTSRELHRVERIVAEVHEIGEPAMALLEPRARVHGYTAYALADLVALLEGAGFRVSSRAGGEDRLHLVDAVRPAEATATA